MTVKRTRPSNLSYDAISKYAEKVGNKHDIYDANGCADVWTLVEKLGGQILVSSGDESLHVEDRRDFTIYIPSTTSTRRDRFTIAHELGHYYLHHLLPRAKGTPKAEVQTSFARGARDRAETEANVFAASLLMPESKFRTAYRDPWSAAAHFDVSPDAADVRAQVLNLR